MSHQPRPGKFTVIALAVAMAVAACGDPAQTNLNTMIDEGEARQALATITEQLQADPSNKALQALALKAHLTLCVAEDCPASNPARLKDISTLASGLPQPVKINEKTTLSPQTLFADAATRLAMQPSTPAGALVLRKAAPADLQAAVTNGIFAAPLLHLRNGKPKLAGGVTQALSNTEDLGKPARYWAMLLNGLIVHQPTQVEGAAIALRSQPATTQLPPAALQALPQALLGVQPDAATLAQALPSMLEQWKLPLLTAAARKTIADEVNFIRTTPAQLARLEGGGGPILTSSTTTLSTPSAQAQLYLMRLSLALAPAQTTLWQEYLPLVAKALAANGPATLLAGEGAPTAPPTQVQEAYVTTLFNLMDTMVKARQSLAPLLTQLGALKLDTATTTKLERLVKDGLETAAKNRQIDDIIAFANFKPNVARANRQSIVTLLMESLADDLRQGRFDAADTKVDTLQRTLDVDFNYDTFILKEFETEARENGLIDALSANTPDTLLQPASSVQADLGRLWAYIGQRFADNPELRDQQLRNLVAAARGMYGLPTAMYRLMDAFPDETFPLAARRQYLNNAISQSLQEDDRLTGAELIELATRLARLHEGLETAPLIDNALARATTVEEGRALWNRAPAAVRATITTIRPQFAAFMRGVDAWDAGRTGTAAASFAELDNTYADKLAPYLDKLRDTLINASGTYAATDATAALPTAAIRVSAPALATSGTLTDLTLTFFARMGHTAETDPQTVTTSYGVVQQVSLPVRLNHADDSVTLSRDQLDAAPLAASFVRLFGDISRLTFHGDTLTATTRDGATATFAKTLTDPAATPLPQGTYLVSSQLSPNGRATDIILPPGSLLTFATEPATSAVVKDGETLGNIHKSTLTLRHPGMAKPQEVEGYVHPETGTFNAVFTPPLVKGGVAKAMLRCQLLGTAMLCGASHTHANREQFTHRVIALQTQEDATAQQQAWHTANAATVAEWQARPISGLLPAPTVFENADTATISLAEDTSANTSATSPATVSETTPVAAPAPQGGPQPIPNTEILPAPDFMQSESSAKIE